DSVGGCIRSEDRRAASLHDLVVAYDVPGAEHGQTDERILIGADIFDDVSLRAAGIIKPDAIEEAPDGAVLDGDVLAVERIDADRVRTRARGEATQLEAVEVQDHVVRLDVDGVARGHTRVQMAGEAVDALHRDDGREGCDRRTTDGFSAGRDGAY